MNLRNRLKNPTVMMRVGMSFVALGILSNWLLRRSPMLPPNLVDGVTGLFDGVGIALLLKSMWVRRTEA